MRLASITGLALALIACGGPSSAERSEPASDDLAPEPTETTDTAEPSPEAPDEPTPTDCASLGPDACIAASSCTLDHAEGQPYACRAAAGPCEEGLAQSDRAACEARAGCEWDPGRCYCPEDVECFCGGGPPPLCRAAPER